MRCRITSVVLCASLLLVKGPLASAPAADHDFAKWEKEISAFEAADQKSPPPKGGLVFIGSSTIGRWKTLKEDFPGQPVINRGFGGSEIVDCTHFADRVVLPYEPKMIFFRAGGNDLNAGKSAEQVFADFKEFVAKVHSKMPQCEIVVISLSPSISRWKQADKEKAVNDMTEAFAKETAHVKFIDCYTVPLGPDGQPKSELFVADKLHFNDAGYRLLVERVRPFLPK